MKKTICIVLCITISTAGLFAEDILPDWFLKFLETSPPGRVFFENMVLNSNNASVWATSFFPPDATPVEDMSYNVEVGPDEFHNIRTGKPATDEEIKKYNSFQNRLKQYAPEKVLDGKTDTAWVENKPDFGRGEIIMIDIDFPNR